MVIGIIGAGISGLTAGRLLAQAGHDVTIFEKSRGYGGRMATRYAGKDLHLKLDHGIPYFSAYSSEFQEFTAELLEKNIIKLWGDKFEFWDGEKMLQRNPNQQEGATFTATQGMNSIGKYLSRWVDVKNSEKVGGLTHIGANRRKKRSWMINLQSRETYGVDAVIVATPAPQAYGILNTTTDETSTLKMIRDIDEVSYNPSYSLMLGFGDREVPEWDGIHCKNNSVRFISNEASKRDGETECTLVVHSTAAFARKHRHSDEETVKKALLSELSEIVGGWSVTPEWSQLHFWRFSQPAKTLKRPYFEMEVEETPLALIGDYFEGYDIDAAYRSGYKLASHWIEKYKGLE